MTYSHALLIYCVPPMHVSFQCELNGALCSPPRPSLCIIYAFSSSTNPTIVLPCSTIIGLLLVVDDYYWWPVERPPSSGRWSSQSCWQCRCRYHAIWGRCMSISSDTAPVERHKDALAWSDCLSLCACASVSIWVCESVICDSLSVCMRVCGVR